MRVTHVNDVAHVGGTLVEAARNSGLSWEMWRLPEVRGRNIAQKSRIRLADIGRFARVGHRSDVLHIHYGLFGYYARAARRPYVLHLHGSDVRVNLRQPGTRALVTQSISRAARVVYSTPDLRDDILRIRPDAEWLPAPVAEPSGKRPKREANLVVFGSRWEPFKGSEQLVAAATALRTALPEARLVGLDWGVDAGLARSAGVELLKPLSHNGFRTLLGAASVLVGQIDSGSLGVTEIEALLAETPVVARFDLQNDYGDSPPIWFAQSSVQIVEAVTRVLRSPNSRPARVTQGHLWAATHHSPDRIVRRLEKMYSDVMADQ